MKTFRELVLIERLRAGISQKNLASKIGVSSAMMNQIELKGKIPSLPVVLNICRILGIETKAALLAIRDQKIFERSEFIKQKYNRVLAAHKKPTSKLPKTSE